MRLCDHSRGRCPLRSLRRLRNVKISLNCLYEKSPDAADAHGTHCNFDGVVGHHFRLFRLFGKSRVTVGKVPQFMLLTGLSTLPTVERHVAIFELVAGVKASPLMNV